MEHGGQKFERDPNETLTASEESKKRFLSLVDQLTRHGNIHKSGNRFLPISIDAEHSINVHYYADNPELEDQHIASVILEQDNQQPDGIHIHRQSYILYKSGKIERLDDEFTDSMDEGPPTDEEIETMSPEKTVEYERAYQAKAQSDIISDNEARELGLAAVTEAEFKIVLDKLSEQLEKFS